MFTERLSENPTAVTLRSVNYEKLKGVSKADHPEAGHYNFLALCNGEDFQVKIKKSRDHFCTYWGYVILNLIS